MERLTEKHVDGSGYFLKCSGDAACPENCEDCDKLDAAVDRLGMYEDSELMPDEVVDLASVREITPEAEYAINKYADSLIERMDALLKNDENNEIRRGHWNLLGQRVYGGGRGYTHWCSCCGHHGFPDYYWCPCCGAEMEADDE